MAYNLPPTNVVTSALATPIQTSEVVLGPPRTIYPDTAGDQAVVSHVIASPPPAFAADVELDLSTLSSPTLALHFTFSGSDVLYGGGANYFVTGDTRVENAADALYVIGEDFFSVHPYPVVCHPDVSGCDVSFDVNQFGHSNLALSFAFSGSNLITSVGATDFFVAAQPEIERTTIVYVRASVLTAVEAVAGAQIPTQTTTTLQTNATGGGVIAGVIVAKTGVVLAAGDVALTIAPAVLVASSTVVRQSVDIGAGVFSGTPVSATASPFVGVGVGDAVDAGILAQSTTVVSSQGDVAASETSGVLALSAAALLAVNDVGGALSTAPLIFATTGIKTGSIATAAIETDVLQQVTGSVLVANDVVQDPYLALCGRPVLGMPSLIAEPAFSTTQGTPGIGSPAYYSTPVVTPSLHSRATYQAMLAGSPGVGVPAYYAAQTMQSVLQGRPQIRIC